MESNTEHNTSGRAVRRAKYATNAIISVVLLAIFLIALNWFVKQAPMRVDLTRNQTFTTSPSTERLLAGLTDNVNITVYATEADIPPNWMQTKQRLRELLSEFRRISKNRLSYTFKDPSTKPELAQEAEQAGVQAQPMQQASATEASIKLGYLGLTAEYQGKKEPIPGIAPNSQLEYQLVRLINKMAQVNTPKVALMAPAGNPMMGEGGQFQIISQVMTEEGFEVLPINPESPEDFSDAKLLMIFDPPAQLNDETLFKIDQYVMKGGSLFVAGPGVQMNSNMGQPNITPGAPNINNLLEHYGLRINEDLIEDWEHGFDVPARNRMGQMAIVKNPLMFRAINLSKDSPITAKISSGAALAFTSSVSQSDKGTSAAVTSLITSSKNSRLQEQIFNIDPLKLQPPTDQANLKEYGVMLMVKGKLTSRYADGTAAPILTSEDGSTRSIAVSEIVAETTQPATVIVQGSALSFSDNIIQQFQPNATFPVNIAESVARDDGGFLEMRGREYAMPALKKVTESKALWTQALIVLGIPALIILFGILQYVLRRMKMARYRREYGSARAS